jgi:hypothetical protein
MRHLTRSRRSLPLTLLLTLTATAALVGLPTVTPAAAAPRPVPASVQRIPLEAGTPGPAGGRTLLSPPRSTRGFSLMGVTWRPDPAVGEVAVEVRHRSAGSWSEWETVEEASDDGPDRRTADTRGGRLRSGTAPVWTGPSDGVQVRLQARSGAAPRDVAIELVDPGSSPADAAVRLPRSTAHAEEPAPAVISRAQWGADESIRTEAPSYRSTVRVGFVHHTASSNDYTAEQAAAVIRGIYAYHVKSNGWSDIGYNYLVDRFGRAYEGRAGGLDRFVVGAHTGGFNTDSFGVALVGDFSTVPAPPRAIGTLTDVLAWKLGAAYRDPYGRAVLTSTGTGTSKYPAGQSATFDVVSAHRDAGDTSCPGATTYARMGQIRQQVSAKLGAGFVDPELGASRFSTGSRGPAVLTAGTRVPLAWTATVTDADGTLLRSRSGRALRGQAITLSWDLSDARGAPVPNGRYRFRLTGSGDGDRALPYSTEVVVGPAACRGTPLQRAACAAASRVPVAAPG